MEKYLTLLKLSWQNGLVYRTSVIMWRLRQFLSTLMSLTVWNVIFQSNDQAFNYSQSSMTTYIFLIAFLQSLVLSSALLGLSGRIYSGEISNHLLKPINIYAYFATEELADKLKNVGFLLLETFALFVIFKPVILFPDFPILLLFLVWAVLAVILNFFITLIFGSFGFWSPNTWGPRFLFFMILNFTAGKLFPLDILPNIIQKVLYMTPFPYLSFVQIQLFLGNYSSQEMITHSSKLIFWIVFLGIITALLWKKGFKNYDAAGR
jgi:ABC-2 type transport system permease protein